MPKKPTYEKLEQRVKELEKESHDSKRLDEQRRFLLLAIERSSEGMAMADMSGNLEYLNDAFANMHGYSPDELVGKNLSIFHSPEQLPVVEAANQQIQETGSFKGELWHVRRDGTVFPTLMHNSLLRDEAGNTIGMIGTLRDISDLKAKEEETKASEAKFRELFNNMSSGVAIYEAKDNGNNFIFKDFNEAAERIDNIKKEDIIGKSVLEVFPGVKEFGLFDVFKRVWETGKPEDHPISLYKDQRISGWRENYVYKLPSGEIVAVYEDITDRKQIEEKLRKEDALKSSILDAIPHAVIGVRERRITFANDGVEPVFGWKPEELIGKNTRIFYRTDEEYEEIGNRIYPVLEKKRTHTVAEDIYMRRKDGRDIICRATSARIGETLKENEIIATFEDVTDRRHAEEALRESEEKYRGLINGMSDTVWVIDFDANFIDVNDASVEVLGYSREELLSMGPQDIDTSVGVEEIKGLIEQMPTDEIQLFETTHITKDGKTIPVEVKSSLVTYQGKKVILSIARDITERKQIEETLRESEAKYRTILGNIEEGYFEVDIAGNFTFFNDSLCEIYGYPREDMMGMNNRQCMDKKNARKVFKAFNKVYSTGNPTKTLDWEIIKKDGGKRFIGASISLRIGSNGDPIGFRGIVRDITKRKRAEEKLQASEARYRSVFENTGTATGIVEEDTTIAMANTGLVKLTGYSKEELEGKMRWTDFVVKEDLERMKGYHDKRRQNGEAAPTEYEFRFVDRKGDIKDISLFVGMIPGTKRSVCFLMDITDHKQAEEKLKKYSENLEEMVEDRTKDLKDAQEQLVRREKLAILGQLAGSMGHELRNPLGIISNAVYYLKMVHPDIDTTTKEYMDIISAEVQNSEKIITDLLDFSRVRQGEKEEIEIIELVAQALERQPLPENVEVVTRIPADLLSAYVDIRQIGQVLTNLISNACHAMPEGGTLTIQAKDHQNNIRLSVADTGSGISEENMEKIFDPLFTTRARGIGLGLAVSRNLVEANGGRLEVKSKEGKGATFTITLPVKEEE